MPTFIYSRKQEYWRPLCRNKLRGETSLPSNAAALPCEVCLYPEEFPPVQGCWCNAVTRPQGVDSTLTFTLGASLGADSASGTFLSNSGSRTYSNAGIPGVPDATMSPADGAKSSVYETSTLRDWITPNSGTTFLAKHIRSYIPEVRATSQCLWIALADMHYVERLYHSTIVQSVPVQTYTYVENGITKTGGFYGFSVVSPHEELKRTIVLDNNDPASVWLGYNRLQHTNDGINNPGLYAKIRSYVPQVATGMPADIGGPCRPVTCNNKCYPVTGHCWSNNALLIPVSGRTTKWYSWWTYRTTINGYYWVIQRHPGTGAIGSAPSCWLAWLVGRDVEPWSTVSVTRPKPIGGVFQNENIMFPPNRQDPGWNTRAGWFYPASYHSALPSVVAPGYYYSDYGGMVTGEAFGGGATGSARHPSWSGSIPSIQMHQCPMGIGTDFALACYATAELPCNYSGTASMQKIADYRTAPNAAPRAISAGPSSFPSSATLTF